MPLLLLLLLLAASSAQGQLPPAAPQAAPLVSGQLAGDTASAEAAAELFRQHRRPALDRDGAAAAEAVQPSMRNFLYQILITAVSALVTALIWKAVF